MTVRETSLAELSALSVDARRRVIEESLATVVRGAVPRDRVEGWCRGVLAAKRAWSRAFRGEQRSLGLAYYTHLEQHRLSRYFAGASRSDAKVEAHAPGLQAVMRDLVGSLTGGPVRPRSGFAGAGVHVFPPREIVAHDGGVVHADHEGLTGPQLARGAAALTVVLMMQPPAEGAALRFWSSESDHEARLDVPHAAEVQLGRGDVVAFPSRRVHQIAPFGGPEARLTATLHAVWVDVAWDTWF